MSLSASDRARFEAQVDRSPGQGPHDDCHEWQGDRSPKGYGRFSLGNKSRRASRVAWLIATGEWPRLCVLHRCDNPPCCNPAHLWDGSVGENNADMYAKGRRAPTLAATQGESHYGARLTEAMVREIRAKQGIETQQALADRFRVSRRAVQHVQQRSTWRHVA